MIREGIWVIEIEILVVLYILKLDIYIYSDNCWLKYFVESIYQRKGFIYLDYKDENYYNVVFDVGDLNVSVGDGLKIELVNVKIDIYLIQCFFDKKEKSFQYKREMFNRKYKENVEF